MRRPQDTLRQLCEIFPSFSTEWEMEGAPPEDGLVDDVYYEWSHHAVVRAFLVYFATNHTVFVPKQLRLFGDWVNLVLSNHDDLENAVSTCFLEHTRQVKIDHVLAPYLSREAKDKEHA